VRASGSAATLLTISARSPVFNIVESVYFPPMPRYTEVVYPVKKLVPLTTELAERIRDFRFKQRIDSENEAIRRLIELGLKTAEKQPA
jgi:hypothetical protein